MELVHDDVVEVSAAEDVQMALSAEGLDRREDHIGIRLTALARIVAEAGRWPDGPKGLPGLGEYLLPVGHEKDPTKRRLIGVERAKPRLPQACGEHHQPGSVADEPSGFQSGNGLLLNLVGLRRR